MYEIFDDRYYIDKPYIKRGVGSPIHLPYGNLSGHYFDVFIVGKDNLFGDEMPLNLAGITIKVIIKNEYGVVKLIGTPYIVNMDNSMVRFKFNEYNKLNRGRYNVYYELTTCDNIKYTIPEYADVHSRIELFVY